MGPVRRSFDVQDIFCPLTSLEIAAGVTPRPSSNAIIPLNLLNSDSLEVTVTLAQTVPFFGNVCIEPRSPVQRTSELAP